MDPSTDSRLKFSREYPARSMFTPRVVAGLRALVDDGVVQSIGACLGRVPARRTPLYLQSHHGDECTRNPFSIMPPTCAARLNVACVYFKELDLL